jgi:hypothetical protein
MLTSFGTQKSTKKPTKKHQTDKKKEGIYFDFKP